jgi:hypothetical protein
MAKSMMRTEKGEEYIPLAAEVFSTETVKFFRRLVKAYGINRDKAKALETEMDGNPKLGLVGIKPQLIELMKSEVLEEDIQGRLQTLVIPGGKVRDDETGVSVALIPGTRKSLSKELLLANGVSLEVIGRCMVESTYETLRVTGI